jgi:hypothetical protein
MWSAFKRLFQNDQTDSVANDPVIVATCNGPIEASMLLSQLHDSGIPAASLGAESAAVFGMQSGILAEVRIVVPAAYVDEARELIAEFDLSSDMTITTEDAELMEFESDTASNELPNEKQKGQL